MRTLLLLLLSFATLNAKAGGVDAALWAKAESWSGVRRDVFYGMALRESGHAAMDVSGFAPWPWTLGVALSRPDGGIEHKGHWYASRAEAEAALQLLLDQGVRNIGVGATQVNLRWHGSRVAKPQDLLDPETNVRVGAEVLKECLERNGSVVFALSCYSTGKVTADGLRYANDVIRYAVVHGGGKPLLMTGAIGRLGMLGRPSIEDVVRASARNPHAGRIRIEDSTAVTDSDIEVN